jgi:hypothetical protein
MDLNTNSGLRGVVLGYLVIEQSTSRTVSIALVRRADAPHGSSRAYSTHRLYERVGEFDRVSTFEAESGHYDMTLDEARADLLKRASAEGWVS